MVNIVPLAPHDLVIHISLDAADKKVYKELADYYKVTDPRSVFWKAWEWFAPREFTKPRYRMWSGIATPKHTTKRTDGQKLHHGHVPDAVDFQFRYMMDVLLLGVVLGRRHETDPGIALCQILREHGQHLLGKVAVRRLVHADEA